MPDDLDAGKDASVATDAGPKDATVDAPVDAFIVAVRNHHCEEYSAEAFGLRGEIASRVQLVLEGPDCKPIFVAPAVSEQCGPEGPIPVNSKIQFEGTLLILEDPQGFQLDKGQMLYTAVQDACGRFPDVEVRSIGLKFKATGLTDAEIQTRLEEGKYGEVVARVHVWTGEGVVETFEGEEIAHLLAGQQAVVNKEGEILQIADFDPEGPGRNEIETPLPAMPNGDQPDKKVGVSHKGCEAVPGKVSGLDPLMGAIALLLVTRRAQKALSRILG